MKVNRFFQKMKRVYCRMIQYLDRKIVVIPNEFFQRLSEADVQQCKELLTPLGYIVEKHPVSNEITINRPLTEGQEQRLQELLQKI